MSENGKPNLTGNDIDPNAGLCLIQVTFNPVNGQCNLSVRGVSNDVIALGMLDFARILYIEAKKKNAQDQPRVVVPTSILRNQ